MISHTIREVRSFTSGQQSKALIWFFCLTVVIILLLLLCCCRDFVGVLFILFGRFGYLPFISLYFVLRTIRSNLEFWAYFFTFICAHLTVLFLGRSKKQSFASKTGLDFSLLYRHCFAFKIQLIFIHFTVTGPDAETPGKTARNWRGYRPQMYQLPMERNPKRLRRFLTSPPFVLLNIQIWKGSYNNRMFLYE